MTAKLCHCLTTSGLLVAVALAAVACARPLRQGSEPPSTAAATSSAGNYAPGDYVEDIVSGGQTRRYRLHVPPGYQPGKPWPLVINLHGFNSNAAQQEHVSKMSDGSDVE